MIIENKDVIEDINKEEEDVAEGVFRESEEDVR